MRVAWALKINWICNYYLDLSSRAKATECRWRWNFGSWRCWWWKSNMDNHSILERERRPPSSICIWSQDRALRLRACRGCPILLCSWIQSGRAPDCRSWSFRPGLAGSRTPDTPSLFQAYDFPDNCEIWKIHFQNVRPPQDRRSHHLPISGNLGYANDWRQFILDLTLFWCLRLYRKAPLRPFISPDNFQQLAWRIMFVFWFSRMKIYIPFL